MLDNLTGELRVFAKTFEVKKGKKSETRWIYNTQIGSTKVEEEGKDAKYINAYVPVNFSTKVSDDLPSDLEDGDYVDIILKDGWFKAYTDKEGHTHPILFVNKAKVVK